MITKRILLTGGGTGGHIFPLVAVTQKLKEMPTGECWQISFIGPASADVNALKKEGVNVKTILAGKFRRYFGFSDLIDNIIDSFKIPISFLQVGWHLWRIMPDVIFSKGGYGSLPVVCVGWIYRIPIIIHESDSVPGLTNILSGRLATSIALSFPRSLDYFNPKKSALIGHPIRQELLTGDLNRAKNIFQLTSERPVLLIIGGSQGAQAINSSILQILIKLLENFEIIHQCGEKNYKQLKIETEKSLTEDLKRFYHLYPFLDQEMKHAYAACDLVISRAGAGSIFEIAAVGKPSILIPLPDAAGDHQRSNAFDYAKCGATLVLEQENLTEHMLLKKIEYLITRPELLQKMGERAKSFVRLDAAEKIAAKIIELAS